VLASLGRRTTSGSFVPQIDGLRFLAISSVVLFHIADLTLASRLGIERFDQLHISPAQGALHRSAALMAMQAGSYGVQLFFTLSGFILALPFARSCLGGDRPVQLRKYYARRLTRLEPPYLVAMGGLFLVEPLISSRSFSYLMPHLAIGALYLHNVSLSGGNPIDPVVWTLEIEVQFYLLMPLLAQVYRIDSPTKRRALLAVGIVALTLLRVLFIMPGTWQSRNISAFLQFFLAGMLIADIYVTDPEPRRNLSSQWDVAFLTCLVAVPIAVVAGNAAQEALSPVLIGSLLLGGLRGRVTSSILGRPWIYTVGGMCYSIYLLHYPMLLFASRFTSSIAIGAPFVAQFAVQTILLVPLIVVPCALFFVAVERPCMDPSWATRLRERAPRAAMRSVEVA
jgi:peptidoglycan/LPS O-acetylase OafA/YrhL